MEAMQRAMYVAVGVPGCGKTTWGTKHFGSLEARPGLFHCVDMNTLRQFLFNDRREHRFNKQVSYLAYGLLRIQTEIGTPIVYWNNPTQLSRFRESCTMHAKPNGYRAIAVHFPMTLEQAKERNAAQPVPVPDHIITKMWESINAEPPSLSEGFDEIVTVQQQ